MEGLLDRALDLTDYHAKSERFARENNPVSPASRKALASPRSCMAPGFTGSGEVYLAISGGRGSNAEGRVRILAASTEIGQGTNTIFSQIAADALGLTRI